MSVTVGYIVGVRSHFRCQKPSRGKKDKRPKEIILIHRHRLMQNILFIQRLVPLRSQPYHFFKGTCEV